MATVPDWPDLPGPDGNVCLPAGGVEKFIFTPPCECIDCETCFYKTKEQVTEFPHLNYRSSTSGPGKIADIDVQLTAEKYVRDAAADREYIQQLLNTHGDIVMSRWKKRKEKRRAVLLAAHPELYEGRWLIPSYLYTLEKNWAEVRAPIRRWQSLLPWLNLEVLTANAMTLLALLKNRTFYSPQDWATYDSRQHKLGWNIGHFDVQFSAKCVVMHGIQYGRTVDWEAGAAHRCDTIGWPRARLILEAQANLLAFLRKVVDKILEGIDLDKPTASGSEKWKAVTVSEYKHLGEIESWSPYTNQAFSAPPRLDVDVLLSKAHAHLNARGDHLWFLQTDPSYMRRYMRTLNQGEARKMVQKYQGATGLVRDLYDNVLAHIQWQWVIAGLEKVSESQKRFRDSIFQGQRLPPSFDRALGELELLLVNLVRKSARFLSGTYPERPAFQAKWKLKYDPVTQNVLATRKEQTTKEKLYVSDPLDWCLLQMTGMPDEAKSYDHALLFAFLEDHLRSSPAAERARLDEILYQQLSDLAAFHEFLMSVRCHRPQNTSANLPDIPDMVAPWKNAEKMLNIDLKSPEWKHLPTTLMDNFYRAELPTGEQNAAWLERSQAIHRGLNSFWTGLRTAAADNLKSCGMSTDEVVARLNVITASSNPEYISAVEAETKRILANSRNASTTQIGAHAQNWDSDPLVKLPLRPAEGLKRYVINSRLD
jgi:hypothetical protein